MAGEREAPAEQEEALLRFDSETHDHAGNDKENENEATDAANGDSSLLLRLPRASREKQQRLLWLTLLSQAGVAMGLALEVSSRFPTWGE